MAEYRVGGAFEAKARRQVEWIEANRPDLQPVPVIKAGDPLVHLVITLDADDEEDALAQAEDAFLESEHHAGVSESDAGPTGMEVWLVSEDPPADYKPS